MQQEIIDFWFSAETRKLWFKSTRAFDNRLRERYQETWQQACQGEFEDWKKDASGCLALVIVTDQFPLNMFRGSAQSYASEALSREVARIAIDRGFDEDLTQDQKAFLYMPFMHSENFQDQALSVRLYQQSGLESNLRFARHHQEIIVRFGRFPHRNAALGRSSSDAEIEYLNSKNAFTG